MRKMDRSCRGAHSAKEKVLSDSRHTSKLKTENNHIHLYVLLIRCARNNSFPVTQKEGLPQNTRFVIC